MTEGQVEIASAQSKERARRRARKAKSAQGEERARRRARKEEGRAGERHDRRCAKAAAVHLFAGKGCTVEEYKYPQNFPSFYICI